MGRLLIFAAIILVVLVLLGLLGVFLANRKERANRGLTESENQIKALQATQTRHAAALEEIRGLAETEITLGDGQGNDTAMWRVVQGLTVKALKDEETK